MHSATGKAVHHVPRHTVHNVHTSSLAAAAAAAAAAARPSKPAALFDRPRLNQRSYSLFTQQIKGCKDWSAVRGFYHRQRYQLNTINLLAVVHQLTKVTHCAHVNTLLTIFCQHASTVLCSFQVSEEKRYSLFEDADRDVLISEVSANMFARKG
jgi:hypothetical protein